MITNTHEEYNQYVSQYANILEMKYLRKKSLYVSIVLLMLMLPITLALYNYGFSWTHTSVYAFVVLMMISTNILFLKYPSIFKNIKLAMVITTMGIYLISLSLIIDIQSPSVFTMLFVAYALVSIYQDRATTFLNNISLFLVGNIIIIFYSHILQTIDVLATQIVYVYLFLIIFVALLSIAFSILIKRKSYFYYQIAKIKEDEVRNLQILTDLKVKYKRSDFNFEDYYDSIDAFSEALCEKLGITNTFKERISILKRLHIEDTEALLKKYPNDFSKQIEELSKINIKINSKVHHLILKASQITQKSDLYKETKSENQFASFKHVYDESYTKILAFSVFYSALKSNKVYLDKLSGEEILHLIDKHDFKHLFDSDILDIYLDNWRLIDKISLQELEKMVKP